MKRTMNYEKVNESLTVKDRSGRWHREEMVQTAQPAVRLVEQLVPSRDPDVLPKIRVDENGTIITIRRSAIAKPGRGAPKSEAEPRDIQEKEVTTEVKIEDAGGLPTEEETKVETTTVKEEPQELSGAPVSGFEF